MNKKQVFIFGAGGHGKVMLDILLEAGVKVAGFLDDDKAKIGNSVCGYEILGGMEYLTAKKSVAVALGIGNNKIREKVFHAARAARVELVSAVHPRAVISRYAAIGGGVAIMAGAVINAGSTLEDGVVVNTAASVDHDCRLGKFCQIWPGAHLAGNISIGEFSYVGTGASVIQNIKIGKNTTIGAGAAVISDIPDNVTAAGVPARVL